jgi:hypothetical protein
LRGAFTAEFGAAAAEILQRDHPRLLLVSDLHPGWMHPDPNGHLYQFFFWDAYCKKLLLPDPVRDRRLADELAEIGALEKAKGKKHLAAWRVPVDAQRELQKEMAVDGLLGFNELWNTLAYTCFHTAWTRLASFQPRSRAVDDDPGARPLESRYDMTNNQALMAQVHGGLSGCLRQPDGQWVEDSASPVWRDLEAAAVGSFPVSIRPRSLLLVTRFSAHYLDQLSPLERSYYDLTCRLTVQHLAKVGLPALDIGEGFGAEDFSDLLHMTSSGGAKMAEAVAPAVQAMALRLGYKQEGRSP